MHSHGTMKVSDSPHHLCSSRIYQFPPKATLLNMFRIVHRSVILTRRPNHPATRRFNTSGPAAEGSAQGAMPPPPPPPHGDWARRLNEYEHRYKHFAARVNGTGDRKWIGKGPIIGFVGGVLVGSSLFSKRDHGDERTERRIKSLASDLQDESRKLKQQLVSIQQSIDQLKVATPAYAPYPSRPHVTEVRTFNKEERSKQRASKFQQEVGKFKGDLDDANSLGDKLQCCMGFLGVFCDFVVEEVDEGTLRSTMTIDEVDDMDEILVFIRGLSANLKAWKVDS